MMISDEKLELSRLIDAHRTASAKVVDAYSADPEIIPGRPDWPGLTVRQCEAEEERALALLLSWRPATIAGSAERLRYLLLDRQGPWIGTVPRESELDLFFASMIEG